MNNLQNDEANSNTEFKIMDAHTADWAISKILEERQRRDLFIDVAKGKIELLNQQIDEAKTKCDTETSYLLCKLDEYMDIAPCKKLKASYRLELPSGKLVRKLAKSEFVKDDDKLLKYIESHHPDFIKCKKSVDWSEYKKTLTIQGEFAIDDNTGEIVDGISIVERPAEFDVL